MRSHGVAREKSRRNKAESHFLDRLERDETPVRKADMISAFRELEEADFESLEHALNLRSDFCVELVLPVDLSNSEAERLAAFVKTLPLDDYQE